MKEVSIRCEGARSISIDELFPFQDDIKTMKPSTLRKLEKVILEQGFSEPIAVWANSPDEKMWILNGHQRMTALQSLKSKGYFIPPIPVTMVQADDEQEARKKVLTLASQFGDFDGDNLSEFVAKAQLDTEWIKDNARLAAGDFKLPLLMTPVDEEPPPEPEAIPIVQRGEVYILGNHRLMCGDSTSIDAVEKLMDGKKADMVFTSPPYNANTKAGDGDIFNGKKSKKLYAEGYSDNLKSDSYVKFAKDVLEMCFLVTDGFIFWNVSYNANSRFEYIMQIADRLPFLIEQICWKKTSTIPFKGSLMRDWEPVYVFSTNKLSLGISEVVSNHWVISNQNAQQENHKACFPVELPSKGISLVKSKTGIVFEPFGGSGSTLIACEKTHRQCFMMEMDPIYCGVIIDRWEKFADKQAIRESDGRLWLDIKAEALST